MLRRKILSGLLVVAACLFLSMPVQATPPPLSLTVGEWKNFSFDDYSWLDLFAVSLDKPGLLTVTIYKHPATDSSLGLTQTVDFLSPPVSDF